MIYLLQLLAKMDKDGINDFYLEMSDLKCMSEEQHTTPKILVELYLYDSWGVEIEFERQLDSLVEIVLDAVKFKAACNISILRAA